MTRETLQRQPAVQHKSLARDVGRAGGEEEDGLGVVGGDAGALQRDTGDAFGLQVVGLLLTLALSAGLHRFHLRHLREESVSPLAIFAGLSRPLSVGIAFILYYALLLVGLVFFVLPGIWLMVRFMYAPLAIVDQKLGPIAGLRESARVVSALGWWQSFGVLCSSAAIGAFGMLWFLVGGLITLPVAIASWTAAYDTAVANLGRRG